MVAHSCVIARTILCILAALTSALPAAAQSSSKTVRLEGRSLFRVWDANANAAAARARRIERRFQILLDQQESVGRISIRNRSDERLIFAGPVLITTVTPLDAEEELTTVDGLAQRWAGAIRTGLDRERRQRVSWGRFASAVGANVRAAFSRVAESAITIIPGIIAALLVLGVFWAIAAAVRALLTLVFRRAIEDPHGREPHQTDCVLRHLAGGSRNRHSRDGLRSGNGDRDDGSHRTGAGIRS